MFKRIEQYKQLVKQLGMLIFTLSLFTISFSSHANVTGVLMFTLLDGTGPLSPDDDPGNDSAFQNEIIRTNDDITYRATLRTDGGDTDVVATFALPFIFGSAIAADNGVAPAATWKQVPPQCVGPTSALSADRRVLTCDYGSLPNPSTIAIEPVATVSGRAPNGQEIDFSGAADGEGTASATSIETGIDVNAIYYDTDISGGSPEQGVVAGDGTLDQLVSAAPRFDLMMGDILAGVTGGAGSTAHAFNGGAGPAGEDGLSLAYGVYMFARAIKGSEMLDPAADFSFNQTLTPSASNPIPLAALDAALLVAWSGPSGNQAQNLNPGCANGSLNSFHMPRDNGPSDSTFRENVANGGSLSCTQAGAGAPVTMTIAGDDNFDSSLTHFPNLLRRGGGTNPADNNEWYVMSKRFAQFVPLSLLPAAGTFSIDSCVQFNTIPVSISGQDNVDPVPFTDTADAVGGVKDTANNCHTSSLIRTENGSFSKRTVTTRGAHPVPLGSPRDPRITGDDRVNVVAPGQIYAARIIARNSGSESFDYIACDKIDNARQVIIKGPSVGQLGFSLVRPSTNPPALGTVEWGVRVGDGRGTVTDSWGEYPNANLASLGGDELNESNNPTTNAGATTMYERSTCPDADATGNTEGAPEAWFADLDAVEAGGYALDQVTMMRMSGLLGAGQEAFYYPWLKLRTSFKYTASDVILKPVGSALVYSAGDVIPIGSHVPNVASFVRDGGAGITSLPNASRDVIEVNHVHYLRIKKTAAPSAGTQVAPGQTVSYTLQPNYTTPDFGTPADVTVTDVLPPGLTYLATTSGPVPTVLADTPAAGFTTLEWTLANVTPVTTGIGGAAGNLTSIEFTARVNTDLLSGDQLFNWTSVSDGGFDHPSELDCDYDAGNDPVVGYFACRPSFSSTPVKADDTVHTVSAPPGFQLFKEVLVPQIYPGQQYIHRINWASIGASTADLRVIDILPWNGDTRGTDFTGTMELASATPVGDLVGDNPILYYTNTAPGSIVADPFDGSNALGGAGSTLWCDAGDDPASPDIGTVGCPGSLAEATAVMVDQSTTLLAGITYSVELTFDTLDNAEDDVYANNHTANDSGADLDLLLGNTVQTIVLEPTVGDLVWHDYNGNGTQDAGEPGLAGVTVELMGTDIEGNPVNITTITGAGGDYLFDSVNGLLRPSDATGYTVTVIAGIPAGLFPVFDLDNGTVGADGSSGAFVLNAADDKDDVDFGYSQFGDIIVNKTVNGADAPSPWNFTLASEMDGCAIPTAVTNPNNTPDGGSGVTSFAGLPLFSSTTGDACTYSVTEIVPTGYMLNTTASDTLTGLAPTSVIPEVEVDIVNDQVGQLSGNVFNDADGLVDSTVDGIGTDAASDLTAYLIGSDGKVYASTDIAADGTYSFTDLPLDTYSVVIVNDATIADGAAAPSPSLPLTWLNTGDNLGAGAGDDGTADGHIINIVVIAGDDITDVNFGIQRPPTATNSTAASQPNPGGTTTVPTTGGFSTDDPEDGANNEDIRITALPTNVTSITINGVTYGPSDTAFPAAGVTVPQANIGAIVFDPLDSVTEVVISFVSIDDAGEESASATATFPLTGVSLTGHVFNDANHLTDSIVNGPGTDGGSANLTAYLIDTAGNVVTSTDILADGSYSFESVQPGIYQIVLADDNSIADGAAAPVASLPAGWIGTGENLGAGAGNDGSVDSILTGITVATTTVTEANFGIQRPPTAINTTAASQPNPGGTTTVPTTGGFSTDDPEDGANNEDIRITALPTNVTSITINGVTYGPSDTAFPAAGVTVPQANIGAIVFDPLDSVTEVVIPFVSIDDGAQESAVATATFPLTGVSLTGHVFNDANHLTDSIVNGPGTDGGSANLTAYLINAAGNVVTSTDILADGSYSFGSVEPGIYRIVLVDDNSIADGAAAPVASLPAGWVGTGENLGAGAGNDGSVDSILTGIAVTTTSVTEANFGIQRPPTATNSTAASQPNPGGTTTVPTTGGFSTDDPEDGANNQDIRITSFPANVTSITINGVTYGPRETPFPAEGVTVPQANIGAIVFDPLDSVTKVVISFISIDDGGEESAGATATFPLTGVSLTGHVFNDANHLTDSIVNGPGTDGGSANLTAYLINAAGKVVTSTDILADGSYSFENVQPGIYQIVLADDNSIANGAAAPVASLPAGWVGTGENLGAGAGNDGSVDSILTGIAVAATTVTEANFGIQRPPTAINTTAASQPNPGGTTTVPTTGGFSTNDPEDGANKQDIRITTIPANVTSITINGVIYGAGETPFPAGGVTVPKANIGLIVFDPLDSVAKVVISFVSIDDGGEESAGATATFPLEGVSITGHVLNDANGLTDSIVNGLGTDADSTNLTAYLINTAGNVVDSADILSDGSYSFGSVEPGIYRIVLVDDNSIADGAAAPVASLPPGWVNTGENLGAGTGNDGAVDGILTGITVTTTSVTEANFGIEQPPVAGNTTQPEQTDPGGTATLDVPSTGVFVTSDPEDTDSVDAPMEIIITELPTDVDSITIDGVTYGADFTPFPSEGVPVSIAAHGTITFDPKEGVASVIISYVTVDNADIRSNLATVTIPLMNIVPAPAPPTKKEPIPAEAKPIPTISDIGLIFLMLIMMGVVGMRTRRI